MKRIEFIKGLRLKSKKERGMGLGAVAPADLAILKKHLDDKPEVIAAYLFGSAAKGTSCPADLDILVLVNPVLDLNQSYFDLTAGLSDALGISGDRIDLLFFNMDEANPMVLYEAVSTGILLKNSNPHILGEHLDALSRYFLDNAPMIERARRLRNDRLEEFCGHR